MTQPLSSADINIISPENSNFRFKKKKTKIAFKYIIYKSLKVVLIRMIAILMMSAKLATEVILQTKYLEEVLISVHNVTRIIL